MPGSNPAVSGGSPRRRSGRSHEAPGNGCPRGMAITVPGAYRGAGQNPAYRLSGEAFPVDGLADQFGISAVSRGQPCGSPNPLLHVEKDRIGSPIVWSTRRVSRP